MLNAILSTLGTSANLTAVGYEGLANTYFTVNQLITASAGLLSTSNVLTTSLTGAQWLSIFKTAADNQQALLNCGASPEPSPCVAYTNLGSLTFGGNTTAKLCQLVSINGSTCSGGNALEAGLDANLDLLQTLTTEAELANGANAIDLGTSLGLAGVTDAQLTLATGPAAAGRLRPRRHHRHLGPGHRRASHSRCPGSARSPSRSRPPRARRRSTR